MRREKRVRNVILDTVRAQKGLSLGIVFAVVGAVVGMLLCWKCGVYKLYNKALAKTSGGKREEHKEPAEKS